jgi:hypothetical protein
MKPKNRKEKLYRRIADFMKGPQGKDRTASQWTAGGFHKPGSNKK